MTQPSGMLAIEVGSSRVKLGWFPAASSCTSEKPVGNLPIAAPPLPEPAEVFRIDHRRDDSAWLADVELRLDELALPPDAACVLAAVQPAAAGALQKRVLSKQSWSQIKMLARTDIAIETNVREPNRVGMDRLLNTLAANRVRHPQRAAIVVDVGTAMTVNLISPQGVFEGGAILAGPMTALRALHSATLSLPLLGPEVFESPPEPVGKDTREAMSSGAFWGAIGAARQLIERTAATCADVPDVFLTGGAAHALAPHIGLGDRPARYMPNLILSGIYLATQRTLRP